jgi:hypothetical protein
MPVAEGLLPYTKKQGIIHINKKDMAGFQQELLRLWKPYVPDYLFKGNKYVPIKTLPKLLKLPYGRNTFYSKLRALGVLTENNTPVYGLFPSESFKIRFKTRKGNFNKGDQVLYVAAEVVEYIKKKLLSDAYYRLCIEFIRYENEN